MANILQQQPDWQEHLARAEAHPVSQMAYCRENGINPRKLFGVRERIKSKLKRDGVVGKKPGTNFVRVAISEPVRETQAGVLPEPEWVARFILCLARGAR